MSQSDSTLSHRLCKGNLVDLLRNRLITTNALFTFREKLFKATKPLVNSKKKNIFQNKSQNNSIIKAQATIF